MISTVAVICIFLQIFVAGITGVGAYSFAVNFLEKRNKADIYLSLVFASFATFTSLTVISQIIYTLGQSINLRFLLYRIIYVVLILGTVSIACFIKEKFNYKNKTILTLFLMVCIVEIIMIVKSPINLVGNIKEISLDPGIHFLSAIPPEIFWVILWLIMGIKFIHSANATKNSGERNVYNLSGVSSIIIMFSFFLAILYAKTGETFFLLGSWAIYLCSAIGLFLGNIISPKEEIANFPFSYFRTRILYKLILIFILLIIILLEATTIATLNLNQISLQKAIKTSHLSLVKGIADKIDYLASGAGRVSKQAIQKLIAEETMGNKYVYVVSSDGTLFVSPDPKEEGKNIKSLTIVKKVLAGGNGSLEYFSEFFENVEDKAVIGTYAPVPKYKLGVIMEEPKWKAYSEVRLVSTNTLIFVIVGIFLTVSVGIFFAKSIEGSIREVIAGTEAVRKGNLAYKIKIESIDEIGQLADAFNQMTMELRQSQDNLISSEKLASLGTMAAGMAHEIKNPLVSLRTFTQLLPQRFEDEEFRRKFVTVVPQEIDKINKIAESLLRFGRRTKPELTQINLNEILEEILALFDNEARKNNVRVTTKLAELPKITADAGQLSQAFVNIILNSIQAMTKGGELTVKTDVGEIVKLEASSKEEEEEIRPVPVVFVEISDTGVGISDENLSRIFDPFFTTKEVGGTGMGLPITLRIIEDHKGSIRVRSQVGKGTTFLITLPQAQETKA